jgi:hypothetical protein
MKIEKGIPIPTPKGKWRAIFDKMKVGDSVLFPPDKGRSAANASYAAGVNGKHFVTRRTKKGYRVWRTQ